MISFQRVWSEACKSSLKSLKYTFQGGELFELRRFGFYSFKTFLANKYSTHHLGIIAFERYIHVQGSKVFGQPTEKTSICHLFIIPWQMKHMKGLELISVIELTFGSNWLESRMILMQTKEAAIITLNNRNL